MRKLTLNVEETLKFDETLMNTSWNGEENNEERHSVVRSHEEKK